VDDLAKKMPRKLFFEWAAFLKLENDQIDEDIKMAQLERKATQGVKDMRAKRKR
jgi:hypothetical protein